jgi:hypothetical protein
MAKQKQKKKINSNKKEIYKPKELNNEKKKKKKRVRSDHELVEQHVQKNHIYLLFVHHIVHNEMDYRENNVIVYVYNTLQNL